MKLYIIIVILISIIFLILGFINLQKEKKIQNKEVLKYENDKEALQIIKGRTYENKTKFEEDEKFEIFDENNMNLLTEEELNIIYKEEEN